MTEPRSSNDNPPVHPPPEVKDPKPPQVSDTPPPKPSDDGQAQLEQDLRERLPPEASAGGGPGG